MDNASKHRGYPQFYQLIMPFHLEDGTLGIPLNIGENHEILFSTHACLEVSMGKMWKVQLKICDDRVWLHKGWKEFVEDCSIKSGYSLVFRYEGGSFFHVVIFDTSRLEIEYPEDQRVNSDQPNVTNIKKEDGDDDSSVEIMAEWPSKTREEISVSSLSRLSKGDEEVLQGKGLAASSARDGVLQRARAFRSPNPHFIVIMKPAYDSHLDILESDATSHFHGRNDNEIYLMGPDAVAWPMKYSIGDPPLCQVRIISGWDKFSQAYHLLDGDACIFERLSCTLLALYITIFRTDEEGEGNREITEEGAAGDGQLNREVPEGDGEEDNRKIAEEGDG